MMTPRWPGVGSTYCRLQRDRQDIVRDDQVRIAIAAHQAESQNSQQGMSSVSRIEPGERCASNMAKVGLAAAAHPRAPESRRKPKRSPGWNMYLAGRQRGAHEDAGRAHCSLMVR